MAYISNALIAGPVGIHLGCAVAGTLTANYSGSGRAQMDSRTTVENFDPVAYLFG